MTECVEWHLSRIRAGYGQKRFQGKMRLAHRLAYVAHHDLAIEDIDGQVVMHTCDNPPCVNPDHLKLGTCAENNADKARKGRSRGASHPGESNSSSVLTECAVRWIRSYYSTGDYTQGELAEMFGVSRPTVGAITAGRTWKHVA